MKGTLLTRPEPDPPASRWRMPVLGSCVFHLVLLAVAGTALLSVRHPFSSASPEAATMLTLIPSPVPTPRPVELKPAPPPIAEVKPVPPRPKPLPASGTIAVLTPKPKPLPAAPKPAPVRVAVHRTHAVRPVRAAAAPRTAPAAPVASSFAAGDNVLPHPPYPDEARERREIGTVRLNVRFNAGGGVADVEITRSSGSLILDHETTSFIRAHWHSQALAGQTASVPVQYSLENM